MSWRVYVDKNKCDGCKALHNTWASDPLPPYLYDGYTDGECVKVCPVEVFEMISDKSVPTDEVWCIGCESCMEVCPTCAIEVYYDDV